MKKGILAAALLTSTLAVGAFAQGGMYNNNCMGNNSMMNNNNCNNMQMMNKRGNCNSSMMHKRGGMKMMRMFNQLNLSTDQRTKIYDIMMDQRTKMQTMNSAFTKSNFDKEKYVKMALSKRENMIKLRAETIEKVHALLTPIQKEQFKVLIDLRANRFKGL